MAPCNCNTCQEWASVVVATQMPRKERLPAFAARAPEPSTAEFMRAIVAIACKATGLNEAELRRRANEVSQQEPRIMLEDLARVARGVVAARGVPEKHLRAIYDALPVECDALVAVRAFIASAQTMLVLSGGVGLRKTGSACWGLVQKPGVFITATELVRISASHGVEDVEAWRRARNSQLLVIDDVGGEYADAKGYAVKVVNEVFDHRYSSVIKTIITTNLPVLAFRKDYGERTADRIRESGKWVTLGGKSVRA